MLSSRVLCAVALQTQIRQSIVVYGLMLLCTTCDGVLANIQNDYRNGGNNVGSDSNSIVPLYIHSYSWVCFATLLQCEFRTVPFFANGQMDNADGLPASERIEKTEISMPNEPGQMEWFFHRLKCPHNGNVIVICDYFRMRFQLRLLCLVSGFI